MTPNWPNKTVFVGDNLHVMRGMNSESVDLIYLDPPFNSNRNYAAPVGSKAAEAAFKDTWTLDDVDVIEHDVFRDRERGLYTVIATARETHSKGMFSYLLMMAVRLLEMRRLLKPTGSIYLHCDPTASHYIKLVMDAVFGRKAFRNEIIWCYRKWSVGTLQFVRNHDVILFYAVGEPNTFNVQTVPVGPGTLKRWKGKKQRAVFVDGVRQATATNEVATNPCPDWWNISILNPNAKERVGYPTQKPLALLDRIIKASSNEGDVVFDPFCGCATTMVSADSMGRRWVGCDLSTKAVDLVPRSETHLVFFPAFDELGVAMPVAPRDVSQDRPAAVLMVRIVGVGQREIADAREDRFDPIQPRGVGRREHELHVVVGGPVGHLASRVRREVVEDEVEARRERVARAEVLEEQQHFATSLAAVAPHHESVVRDVVRREVLAGAMAAPVRGAQPRRVPDPAPRTAMVGAHFDGPEFVETDHAGVRRRGLVERTDAFFWRQSRGRGSPSRSSCVGTRTPGRAGCGPAWWRAAP